MLPGTDRAPYEEALGLASHVVQEPGGPPGPDATALLIAGDGPVLELRVPPSLRDALRRDLPILAIGAGMHVLNVALGGRPAQPITGHTPASQAQAGPTGGASDVAGQARQRGRVYGAAPDNSPPGKRQVFLSPGAKLAYTIGGSGWVTVIDDHEHGIREADKADGVLASAYARDGVIEAIELPGRHWVIGVQWPAHRGAELPAGFDNLLLAFLERAG